MLIYFLIIISTGYLLLTLFKRVMMWKKDKETLQVDKIFLRIKAVLKHLSLEIQKIISKKFLIIFAIIALVIIGHPLLLLPIIFLSDDITPFIFLINSKNLFKYLLYSFIQDIAGFIILGILVIILFRRFIIKSEQLTKKSANTLAIIIILILIVVSGFFQEAMRIAITGYPKFEIFSPVGYVLALPLAKIDTSLLTQIHYFIWWMHKFYFFTFIIFFSHKVGDFFILVLDTFYKDIPEEK